MGDTMNKFELNPDAIDREALRLANTHRTYSPRLNFLDTLNPDAQEHFRLLAVQSLTGSE